MRLLFTVCAVVLSAAASHARAEGYALAARAGTTGLGAELTVRLGDSLNLRLGAGGFGYDDDRTVSGIDYNVHLGLKSGNAALDWHPGGSAFRLSGGLLLHGNDVEGIAVPRGTVTIGAHTYSANAAGVITATADYDRKIAPFVTIGAGNGARGGRVFVSFEAGVAFTGTPKIAVTSTRATPQLQADLELEAQEIEDDVDWLKLYPMVSIGIGFRF